MKIVHICLNGYIDGWGYQENVLPEYEVINGDEVTVITSYNHYPKFVSELEIEKIHKKGRNYMINGVKIERINTYGETGNISIFVSGLIKTLKKEKPDLIFHHDVSATTIPLLYIYKKIDKDVVIMVDNHTDFINKSKNVLWFKIYYKTLSKVICCKASYVDYFWGVTNMRCEFINKIYGVKKEKIGLLPLGFDRNKLSEISNDKTLIRKKIGLKETDFIIISGGKMGREKGTNILINSIKELHKTNPSIHLVLFGTFLDKESKSNADNVDYITIIGWCDRKKTLELLNSSDLAVWPLLHTSLIEDAVSCGIPIVVKKNGNTEHLIESNAYGLKDVNLGQLSSAIEYTIHYYKCYKQAALEMKNKYDYNKIAKQIEMKYYEIRRNR